MTRFTKLSKAAAQTPSGPACPSCGGTQFKARRTSTQRAVAAGTGLVLLPLMPKKQVECVTCGAKFRRG